MRPKTVGLIAHTGKAGAAELTRAVAEEFARKSVTVLVEDAAAKNARLLAFGDVEKVARASELLVVLGGDGTLLNAVSQAGKAGRRVFGINIGSLGFLTCANSSAYLEVIDAIADGRIKYSERSLLEVELLEEGKSVSKAQALNDAVVSRGDLSRLIRLQARINGEVLTEFNADGLIIATPTGSTAYSLSAGGPILEPESGVFVITPICPHALTNRSVIVSDSSEVEIEPTGKANPVFLSIDGREPERLPQNGLVRIRRSEHKLQLGFLPDLSFFSVLRQKLKWSGSNV